MQIISKKQSEMTDAISHFVYLNLTRGTMSSGMLSIRKSQMVELRLWYMTFWKWIWQISMSEKTKYQGIHTAKVLSLGSIGQWWNDCLLRGALKENDRSWNNFVSTSDALDEIKEVAGVGTRQNLNMITVVQEMKYPAASREVSTSIFLTNAASCEVLNPKTD